MLILSTKKHRKNKTLLAGKKKNPNNFILFLNMENLTFKATDTWAGVHGTTLIDHRIRKKLGLTVNEYVILDFLHSRKGQGFHTDDLWKRIGEHIDQAEK